jgi:hypothetical protein
MYLSEPAEKRLWPGRGRMARLGPKSNDIRLLFYTNKRLYLPRHFLEDPMKKAISIIIMILLLAPSRILAAGACCDNAIYAQTAPANRPDWVITEICPDMQGDGTGGWNDGKDVFEFIEIYNNSGATLNLYDYCLTYNGYARTNERFEKQIVEITPIKPGDYLDGTNLPWSGQSYECCDLSNKPINPDTCMVAPGEVVVLWVMYNEAYYALWNNGKGVSINDFRSFWSIPENVKVIAVDGAANVDYGGHDKNFNVKNSAVGTYGIALYSEALNSAANTEPGSENNYPVVYTESIELSAWATVDFNNQLTAGSIANQSYHFTVDNQGYGAAELDLTPDSRRMQLLLPYSDVKSDATVGRLLPLQKLMLGVPMEAGESCTFTEDIYVPDAGLGEFQGFVVDGVLYHTGTTFTAPAAGTYHLLYKFANDDITVTDIVTAAPDDTTTEGTGTTADNTGTSTDTGTGTGTGTTAPSGTTTPGGTTTAPGKDGGCKETRGCRSAAGPGIIAALGLAAYSVRRKKGPKKQR